MDGEKIFQGEGTACIKVCFCYLCIRLTGFSFTSPGLFLVDLSAVGGVGI